MPQAKSKCYELARLRRGICFLIFALFFLSLSFHSDYGITEEAVRRYLMRKPMTTTELLTKFKNKKTGVSSEKLVETMTQILKRINPVKQTIQGKMYLSIKVPK